MHAHLFIKFAEINHVIHSTTNIRPSEIIINSSHHRQFLRWGAFHSAKTDSRLLHNLIFIPFTKVASTHSSIKYFQIFTIESNYIWCSPLFLFSLLYNIFQCFFPFQRIETQWQCYALYKNCYYYMIDETFSHTYSWTFSKKNSKFLIGRLFKSVNFLLRHPVYGYFTHPSANIGMEYFIAWRLDIYWIQFNWPLVIYTD